MIECTGRIGVNVHTIPCCVHRRDARHRSAYLTQLIHPVRIITRNGHTIVVHASIVGRQANGAKARIIAIGGLIGLDERYGIACGRNHSTIGSSYLQTVIRNQANSGQDCYDDNHNQQFDNSKTCGAPTLIDVSYLTINELASLAEHFIVATAI